MAGTFHWLEENGTMTNSCQCSDMTIKDYSMSYAIFNFVIIIAALPVLALFGIGSNFVNVVVFTRPALRTSGNAYLLALAVSDFFLVLTVSSLFWMDSARSYIKLLENSPYLVIHVLPLSCIAQTFSIYLTVFAALDCFVSTCVPRVARKWCRLKTANIIIIGTLCGSFLYNCPRFFQLGLHICYHSNATSSTPTTLIEICPTDQTLTPLMGFYNLYVYTVVMAVFPFVLLLGLNAVIVSTVFKARRSSVSGSAPPTSGSDTTTLVMVVILFLACNSLGLAINIIDFAIETIGVLFINFLTDISNFLVIFNSSVNFIIYIKFMKEYRLAFHQVFSNYDQNRRRSFRLRQTTQISSSRNHQPEGYTLVTTTNGVRPYTPQISTALI